MIDVNENGRAPKPVRDLFARNQLSAFLYQKEEQLHRLSFEAEDAFAPSQPIPRLVKCEIPEMEYLGRLAAFHQQLMQAAVRRIGQNLAGKFSEKSGGVWEYRLAKPVTALSSGTLTISVKDRQGNITRVEREISVGAAPAAR